MLYIRIQQLAEIVHFDEMMDRIERAFELYESKQFHMPDRLHVDREEGTILYMPCFTDTVSGHQDCLNLSSLTLVLSPRIGLLYQP